MKTSIKAVLTSAVLVMPVAVLAGPVQAEISPVTNTLTINAGGTGTEEKTVTVPRLPARADIQIAIDTTGSMGGVIGQAKAQASGLVADIHAAVPDAHFSVVDFRDSSDGAREYVIKAPITNNAGAVQAAIDTMTAGGGGDFPEAQNLVLHRAAADDPQLWRANTRKFVVLMTDAPPHGAATHGFPACGDTSADPHGLKTNDVVAALKAAERTLFAVTARSWQDMQPCYDAIAAASLGGSAAEPLGSSLSTQILSLISAASAQVNDVHLEVVGPNPNAGWISFDPPTAGPVATPAELDFTVTIDVPSDAVPGDHVFDIVALADGGDIGHQTLTITVPVPNEAPDCSAAVANPPTLLWSPKHTLTDVGITGVTDPDAGDSVSVAITGVTQDEPVDGLGDGDTGPDAVLDSAGALKVRAERSGTGDGRVYAVSFTATDTHGATCTGSVTVGVPHDKRPGAVAVDSGQLYDSLS